MALSPTATVGEIREHLAYLSSRRERATAQRLLASLMDIDTQIDTALDAYSAALRSNGESDG